LPIRPEGEQQWELPECFGLLRRRLEADDRHGTRAFIRVLRFLEHHSLPQLTDAVDHALAIGIEDPDSIHSILLHRIDQPTVLFRLDGRPHLAGIRVAVTNVSAYAALLSTTPTEAGTEVAS
jgi:hypothetical protein